MPLTKGSGSEDPDSDPDPDPAIFVIDLPDVNKKLIFVKKCMLITYFWKALLNHCPEIKIKCPKEVTKQMGIKVFLTDPDPYSD
jgi:hypothetical protein